MEIFKSISIGPINIYVTTGRMKRRNKRDDIYRNNRKKLLRIKHHLWKQNRGRCMECGREFDEEEMELHHIVPMCERPDLVTALTNLHLVCRECHNRLHGRPLGGGYFCKNSGIMQKKSANRLEVADFFVSLQRVHNRTRIS